jgi:hypothetical protein
MTDMPTVQPETYLLICTDGTEEVRRLTNPPPAPIEQMRQAIGADTIDTVVLTMRDRRPDLVMIVDDHGYESRGVETATGVELVPVRALKPVNRKATELYWSVCVPGTTYEIVGDVVICHD